MKVAIDGRMLLPEMTGAGRYLMGLASALAKQREGDDFELWLQEGLPSAHPVWSIQTERLRLGTIAARQMQVRAQWIVPREVKRRRPDLFHYPHFDLPWATGGEIVATIYDLKYVARPEFFPHLAAIKRLGIRMMTSYTCRRARQIITISQHTARDLQARLKVSHEKITPIPLGVEERFFCPRTPEKTHDFRQRSQLIRPYLLFVGERRPHKNIPGVIQAFATFRKVGGKDYQLIIAGKPYADYRLPEQMVEDLDLQGSVRFIDYVADEDLPLLYGEAEAVVLLSFYEGFGLPILEAMACGTPVVASDTTSLPEAVGEAGWLVPPGNPEIAAMALRQAVFDGEMRSEYISRGQDRARMFTWERCAKRTIEVYHKAVNG
jgi:alpha-1,3-rhamnosyl/mannosyltransferase